MSEHFIADCYEDVDRGTGFAQPPEVDLPDAASDASSDESLPDARVAIVSNMMSGSATQRPVDHARVGPDGRRIGATRRLSRYPARERRRRIYHDLPW